jgi:formylglycine-generating enzyme required for sulfatase activity
MAFTVTKRQAQNQYYDEALAEGVMPLRMMLIPAGTFLMGSPDGELERLDREDPQHEVTVPQFFMAKYPVTQAQWRVVAQMPQVNRELALNPSKFEGDLKPVEQVSWYDAVEFCDRLTIYSDRQYRLPTEAEWEYACRAGTTTPFHFGETLSTDYANYDGTNKDYGAYDPASLGEARNTTTPVTQFEGANAFGLSDMHGNVWEWCQDHWHENYKGVPIDGSAWLSENENAIRILRGGSWGYYPRNCRSACRFFINPVDRRSNLGFRVSCASPRALS